MTNIKFTDLHGQLQGDVAFEKGTTVKDAVASGVEKLGLPTEYASGEPLKWHARQFDTGDLIGPAASVEELENDTVVQLIAEVPAA